MFSNVGSIHSQTTGRARPYRSGTLSAVRRRGTVLGPCVKKKLRQSDKNGRCASRTKSKPKSTSRLDAGDMRRLYMEYTPKNGRRRDPEGFSAPKKIRYFFHVRE